MVINNKIKRTMLENKSQYLGSLVLIILSCLLYTMFNQLTSNMSDSSSSFEKNYIQEDASFIVDKRLSNINELESEFNMIIEETGTLDYAVSDSKTLRIFSENTKVNIPAIIEGNALKGSDILIDPAYAAANKIEVGDSIKLYSKDFKVAGFMSLPNYIYPLKQESDLLNDANSFGIAVISKKEFNALNKGNISYAIKFKGDKEGIENKIAEFNNYLKDNNVVVLRWSNISENPRVTYVTVKIDGIKKVSSSMPIFILLLTCILTGIVMWRMLKREFVAIGTLYALGYRKKEIMKHYLAYPLYIALAGGVIGTVLGGFALRPMLKVMVSYFNMPIDSISFNINYVVISILLPVFFLSICGYFVVNKALKYSPLDLMRGGKEKNKVGFIERKLKLDKLKFSNKFKVREQLRSIPRSIFLLLGVALATMLLLMGFAMKSSMDYLMKDSFDQAFKYNYHYVFNSLQQGTTTLNGEAFSEAMFTMKSDDKINYAVYGINVDSQYITLKDKAGNQLSTNKIIVTKPLADKIKAKAGDTIQVINKLDSREYSITIDSIAETYVGNYIYMPLVKFNNMLKYPTDSYMGLWSKDKLDIPESKLFATVTVDDMRKAFDAMTKPMQSYVGMIAFMAFIIGLIVIYVVTSLIIEENKGNISLMKVLGYRKKEVYSLILNSSSFIVIIGFAVGVPMLLGSISALLKSVSENMSFAFPVTIEYGYIIVGFVIIYLTYEVSKALSRKKVNRISMTEALKSGVE